ncbi:MAG: hypothetical protein RBT60_14630 [Candidatus Krumholzibacteria bacterium]|nr:hypothetical protein [Candidatus Krumholzibacteria bacterium]
MPTRYLIVLLLLVLIGAQPAVAGDDWTVTLRDGSTHEGQLLRLVEGLYILQADGVLMELSDDDIDPRTFKDRPRSETKPQKQLSVTNHYVELHYDGTATTCIDFMHHNTGNHAITEYRFGLAPWEQREIDQREHFDGYGNPLHPTFDPPREQWEPTWDRRVQVDMKLPIPVAPGEYWHVVMRATSRAHYEQVAKGIAWSFIGDYAEDRLVWLKVRLPQGATLVEATPEPSAIFDDAGFRYVMWRQFYHKGERRALRVVFGSN